MGDWSSYSLSDFLLFSPQVYERLFVLHNQDFWPAQLVSLGLGAAVLILLVRGTPASTRIAFLILGAAWLVVGGAFFLGRYQTINWLGSYIAPLAGIQGALLILLGLRGATGLISSTNHRVAHTIGVGVLTSGLLYPVIEVATGTSMRGAQFFGLTPDPTAVASLGAIALLNGRVRLVSALIPAMWCVVTALTLSTLGRSDFAIAPVLLALAILAIAWPRTTHTS